MSITIEKTGFSTIGMYGQNHRRVIINGTPLFYMCTMRDDNDHRIFVLKTGRQLLDIKLNNVHPSVSWIDENMDLLMDQIEQKNSVYIYCKTTSGMIVRPYKESFGYGQPVYTTGHSSDLFDVDSDLFYNVMREIQQNDEINRFWFVDSITGKVL